MRRKRWWRILRRLGKVRHPARAIREWFSDPARVQRKYRRVSTAIRFGRKQAQRAPQKSKRAKWWRKRVEAWAETKARYADRMENNLAGRKIIPRKAWDPHPMDRASERMSNDSEGLFDHHTVSGSPSTRSGEEAEMRNLDRIARSRGFRDFSYSFSIAPSGRIYEGRGKMIEQAATIGYNDTSHSASGMGNYQSQHPTEAMVKSFKWLADELNARKVRGHRDVYATACPGNNLYNDLF